MTCVKHKVRKKLTYYNQFNSNSNKIWLFVLNSLTITSDKKLVLSSKNLKDDFINNDDITPNCVG